jgi:hypothetical protein
MPHTPAGTVEDQSNRNPRRPLRRRIDPRPASCRSSDGTRSPRRCHPRPPRPQRLSPRSYRREPGKNPFHRTRNLTPIPIETIINHDPGKTAKNVRQQFGALAGLKSEWWPAHMGIFGSRAKISNALTKPQCLFRYPRSEPASVTWSFPYQIKLTFGRRAKRLHHDPACGG